MPKDYKILKTIRRAVVYCVIWYVAQVPVQRGKVRLAKACSRLADGVLVRTAYGSCIRARLSDSTFWHAMLGSDHVVAEALSDLQAGECFVDVGANAGVFSCFAAELVDKKGVVLAFEISRREFAELSNNVWALDLNNVVCFPIGLGDEEGLIGFNLASDQHTGGNQIVTDGRVSESVSWLVRFDSLDFFRRIIGERPVTVKIDVEGYELNVLRGMEEFLSSGQVRKVIVEIDHNHLAAFEASVLELEKFMEKFDLTPTIVSQLQHYDQIFLKANGDMSAN